MKLKFLKIPLFLEEAAFFGLAQVLGILSAWKTSIFLNESVPQIKTEESFSGLQFIIYFLIGTLVIFIFLRFFKSNIPFKFFFYLTVFSGMNLIFSSFFSANLALILSFALVVFLFIHPRVWLHNLVFTLGVGGLGGLLGISLTPWTAVLILIVLSIYDWIAVYKTKHMVKLAKEMIQRGAIFALILPEKIRDLFILPNYEVKPGEGRAFFLGGGDVALPLLLSASVLTFYGLKISALTAVFSLFGLLATHLLFILQERKKPMPALPPIALFTIAGFLIGRLIF
ncbi:MAG: hypothetical protein HYV52_02250 [Parcubacteria group bacterium]|nr:hypothetical protein [Parcubacteria group bacterium]